MIIDTHCHLNDPSLYKDRDAFIKKAMVNGVKKIICVGFDYPSSLVAVQIAHEYPGIVYAAVGIHPSETLHVETEDFKNLEKLLLDECVVAVGEIGYDFHFHDVPELLQTQYFERQIKLAAAYNKPVIIHMRDATSATLNILKKHKKELKNGGVIHCYSGSKESVNEFVKLGMYISFGGPLTFLNAKTPKEAITAVPLDRLLFETDSPYLAPHPFRGETNEPANVILVVNEAANLLSTSTLQLEEAEKNNVLKLFGI